MPAESPTWRDHGRHPRALSAHLRRPQATTRREPLSAGDYGLIVDGLLQATVERKSLADLVSSLTTGRLKFQLTELFAFPRAVVVVEERYSQVFKLARVRPRGVAMRVDVRRWAFANDIVVSGHGRIPSAGWIGTSRRVLGGDLKMLRFATVGAR